MNEFELLFEMLKDLNRRVSRFETTPFRSPDVARFNELSERLEDFIHYVQNQRGLKS